MTPVILRHRGTINEFIGEAILVLFGAPFERPNDAERAVRCAWAIAPSERFGPAGTRVRAVFSSLAEVDRARIARLVDAETPRTGAGALTPQV